MTDARRRRKAGDGLETLPATEQEWRDLIIRYSLVEAQLQDLCSYGRFSASTVTKEAFLMVRCIWPEPDTPIHALSYILETKSFFTRKHVAMAAELVNRHALGLDKLDNLLEVICEDPLKTPRRWNCTAADGLGPFSMLVSLKTQIESKVAITANSKEDPLTYAPRRMGHYNVYDASQASLPILESPPPQPAKRQRLHSPSATDTDEQLGPEAGLADIPEKYFQEQIEEEAPKGIPDEVPNPRTPTETLVVDFMVNFLGGIACLLQPLSPRMVCVANAFETTYLFGPVGRRNSSGSGFSDGDVQFRARIDGSIPFSIPPANMLPEAIIFEAKRMERTIGCVPIAVKTQQSMEHTAYIYKKHEMDHQPRAPGTYHTFMIAQDYLSFYLSIGTYNNRYLDYIFGPGNAPVAPGRGAESFFCIQEFGPFNVESKSHMIGLRDIILSLLIWQLEPTDKGEMVREAASSRPI
ncbi:hypothetical protein FQN50_008825 [Emmonsiellopsis sp. PD_5]|nr:hypothetical protein FQN50_008825 [Emmonsiellopsis sp. PD_5]